MQGTISLKRKLIQNTLLSSIFAGCLAWLILLVISTYQSMQMHDVWMHNISEQLLGDITQQSTYTVDELSDEYHIQYVLNYENQIFTQSAQQDLLPTVGNVTESGFHYRWQNGQLVRIWQDHDDELSVYVAQPVLQRFDDMLELLFGFALVLVLLWLLQWGILNWLIQRQLAPIHRLSEEISAKSAQDLTPIASPKPEIAELQPMTKQLNAMLQRVEQSLLSEQRFTADAAHELRSPLSAMALRLQVLQRKHANDDLLQRDLTTLQQDVQRATQVLENLLLLARLDPEQPNQLKRQNVDLKNMLDEQIEQLRSTTQQAFNWHIHLQNVPSVALNEALWQICLRNLIDNAMRYTPEGQHIKVDLWQQDEQVFIQIENAGEGLSDDVVAQLGERFYRVLGTKTQGSGLGLSICQKIVDLHQGHMHLQASALGGLKVVITL